MWQPHLLQRSFALEAHRPWIDIFDGASQLRSISLGAVAISTYEN
jgi:hypothetical protein